jgi:hypothetical protein
VILRLSFYKLGETHHKTKRTFEAEGETHTKAQRQNRHFFFRNCKQFRINVKVTSQIAIFRDSLRPGASSETEKVPGKPKWKVIKWAQ